MPPIQASPPRAERLGGRILLRRGMLALGALRRGMPALEMLPLGIIPLAILAGCGGPPSPGQSAEPRPANEAAYRAERRAEIAAGAPAAPMLHAIASSYWRSNSADSARIALEQAVTQDPRHLPSLAWLSRLYYEAGEVERGIALLEPAVLPESNPSPEILTNLAILKLAWGEAKAAESLLKTSIDRYPSYAPAYGNMGYLHLQAGDLKSAEAEIERAIALDDRVPDFHNNQGIVHRRELRFDDAVRDFGRAIDLDPGFREAHHNLALLYRLYLFDEARARTHFQRFLALGGHADQAVTALFESEEAKP